MWRTEGPVAMVVVSGDITLSLIVRGNEREGNSLQMAVILMAFRKRAEAKMRADVLFHLHRN